MPTATRSLRVSAEAATFTDAAADLSPATLWGRSSRLIRNAWVQRILSVIVVLAAWQARRSEQSIHAVFAAGGLPGLHPGPRHRRAAGIRPDLRDVRDRLRDLHPRGRPDRSRHGQDQARPSDPGTLRQHLLLAAHGVPVPDPAAGVRHRFRTPRCGHRAVRHFRRDREHLHRRVEHRSGLRRHRQGVRRVTVEAADVGHPAGQYALHLRGHPDCIRARNDRCSRHRGSRHPPLEWDSSSRTMRANSAWTSSSS